MVCIGPAVYILVRAERRGRPLKRIAGCLLTGRDRSGTDIMVHSATVIIWKGKP